MLIKTISSMCPVLSMILKGNLPLEDKELREVIRHIDLSPKVIPLKLSVISLGVRNPRFVSC